MKATIASSSSQKKKCIYSVGHVMKSKGNYDSPITSNIVLLVVSESTQTFSIYLDIISEQGMENPGLLFYLNFTY